MGVRCGGALLCSLRGLKPRRTTSLLWWIIRGPTWPYDFMDVTGFSSRWIILDSRSLGLTRSSISFRAQYHTWSCFLKRHIIIYCKLHGLDACDSPSRAFHTFQMAPFLTTDASNTTESAGSYGPSGRNAFIAAWTCHRPFVCSEPHSNLAAFHVLHS